MNEQETKLKNKQNIDKASSHLRKERAKKDAIDTPRTLFPYRMTAVSGTR